MNSEEIPAWLPFLKRVPLFRDLSAEDLTKVASLLKPLSLPRGATLFQQGDAGDAFYIVTSGQVHRVVERHGVKSVTGFMGRGDTLGELSLLTGEPRAYTALLDTTAEFLVLSKADYTNVLRGNPSMLLQLSRTLSARLLQESRLRDQTRAFQPQILVLLCALSPSDRSLFALHFSLSLVEQTRRKVLLVDMEPKGESLARSLGLEGRGVPEETLRESGLRDPALLSRLAEVHASGLGALTLSPDVLAGRLYRSIFLLMNLLREHSDFVVIALGEAFGDVEKSVLAEADQWLLAGCDERKDWFQRMGGELRGFVPRPKKLLEAWLGDKTPAEFVIEPGRDWIRLPWPAELAGRFKPGVSPFEAMNSFPRSRFAVESLARRVGRLRVGIAMGTGAALGYSLIGILKAFQRESVPVDLVAGTSIGSLIGGLYALGLSPEEIETIATGVDKAWVYENLFWDLTFPRSGWFAGTTLLRFLRSYFGEKEFRDLELPFSCVATDIETGEAVVFKEGRVAEAIRASSGIPLLFAPFHHQGRFLVDGGLVDPVPIQIVSQMGADILVSVNLTMPAGERKTELHKARQAREPSGLQALGKLGKLALPGALRSPNQIEIFFQMIYTMEYEIARSRGALAHASIHPDLTGFSWTELHRAKELIEAGEKVAETVLPKIKGMLPFFADSCQVNIRQAPWR